MIQRVSTDSFVTIDVESATPFYSNTQKSIPARCIEGSAVTSEPRDIISSITAITSSSIRIWDRGDSCFLIRSYFLLCISYDDERLIHLVSVFSLMYLSVIFSKLRATMSMTSSRVYPRPSESQLPMRYFITNT